MTFIALERKMQGKKTNTENKQECLSSNRNHCAPERSKNSKIKQNQISCMVLQIFMGGGQHPLLGTVG